MSKTAVTNADGELLGYEYEYPEDSFDQYYDAIERRDWDEDYEEDDSPEDDSSEDDDEFLPSWCAAVADPETEQDRAAWYDQNQF